MIEIAKSYDSFTEDTCDYCYETIPPEEQKFLVGTGNSLMIVYHAKCWKRMTKPLPDDQ